MVPLEGDISFDTNGDMTSGIVHAAPSAGITLVGAGTYLVTFSVSGTGANQVALFLNGALVAGSIYGSGAGTQQNNGQTIVVAGAAGEILTLRNHSSSAALGLATVIGGTQANVNASVAIEKLT